MANTQGLTAENIQKLLATTPELRESIVANLDSQIDELEALRSAVVGRGRSRRAGGNKQEVGPVTDDRTHADAIRHALGLKQFAKAGATSRDLRSYLAENGHPMTSATFGTTLQNLKKAEEVEAEGERGSMRWYLSK